METVKWEEVFEALPDEITDDGDKKRKDIWAIMDLDDSLSLSMYELEKGIAVFTRSEDLFDCYPAVQTAFKFTKGLDMSDDGDAENEAKELEDKGDESDIPLFYSEFQEFLKNLKQYYIYCKVGLQLYDNTYC